MDNQKQSILHSRLQSYTLGIAGVGGLGSNAAISLARVGIGRFILVDFDRVEESNLNRQYFFREHIGKYKVEVIRELINRIDPTIQVTTYKQRLEPGKMAPFFKDADVIIEALDAAETKTQFIEEIQQKYPKKLLVAASGVAGYGHMDRIKTMTCGTLALCYDPKAKSSEEDVLIAPKVCAMANWQADIAITYLLEKE